MKTLIVAGVLMLSVQLAGAAFLVELDGGDQMTVDTYWEDGDKVHLQQGDVDMIVPKTRVKAVKPTADADRPASPTRSRPATQQSAARPTTEEPVAREDLERKQRGIEKHLLRVQALRFESEARGDDPKELKRLQREFKRTQQRRVEVIRELRDVPADAQ